MTPIKKQTTRHPSAADGEKVREKDFVYTQRERGREREKGENE